VDILDKIFGVNNFRGEIIWKRAFAHNDANISEPSSLKQYFSDLRRFQTRRFSL
jgi:adenine specific DNA methylase Mod